MNLKPDKATRDKCDAFAQALLKAMSALERELELAPSDTRGVMFGMGIAAALEGGASAEEICKLVRTLARLNAEQKK